MFTQIENLFVILSGPTPPNASELVLSKHLETLSLEEREDPFDAAGQSFDCINLSSRESNLLMGSLPFQFLAAIEEQGHSVEEAEDTFVHQKMIPFVAIRLPAAEAIRQ